MKGRQIYFVCITVLSCLNVAFFLFSETFGKNMMRATYQNVYSTKSKHVRGLNVHVWFGLCLNSPTKLCNHPTFPRAPHLRKTIDRSQASQTFKDFGQRIFGFLHPNVTGAYQFEILNGSSVELWLSSSHKWQDSQLIAQNAASPGKHKTFSTKVSRKIHLQTRQKYFIDILQGKSGKSDVYFEVVWKQPDKEIFEVISADFLSFYLNDTDRIGSKRYDHRIPESFPRKRQREKVLMNNKHFVWQSTCYLKARGRLDSVLPSCRYEPSYLVRTKLRVQWAAVYTHWHPMRTYPFVQLENVSRSRNHSLSRREANNIVALYMKALSSTNQGIYRLQSIVNVEEKQDLRKGRRYFIELELQQKSNNKTVHLSEYIFQPISTSFLCYPVGLQWNRTADIYFVVTSKNQGFWVQHLIDNMARIYHETNDQHFHLVIFDYESPDIDLNSVLGGSGLKRYTVIRRPGKFIKTEAYNEAVGSVKNPNAIVFLLDLHLDISSNFLESIRKHCIKGKMVYTPIIVRLGCGSSSSDPAGFWENQGFGPIGIYKEDWDRVGGFVKQRKGWGGEDWDIMDSIVEHGLEFERMPTPHVYHYYHSKRGMWRL